MRFVLALFAVLALCTSAHAQKVYSQAELDGLLAPIALQPDGVVSQVLIAATYPDDVAAAAAWSRANPHLRGDDAVRAVEGEPWDPAVKSLAAFPELLARMAESPQWLHDLGQAFLAQEPQVMDTVQGLRQRAQANGQLSNSGQTVVHQDGNAIVVQPRTEVVYVRYYDPYVVYGPWWWPHYHPVVWRPWTPYPVVVHRTFFYAKPDWHHHHVKVVHRPVHVRAHQHAHVVPGKWRHHPPAHRVHAPVRPAHGHVSKPYVRVPESQRKPIVQQHQQPMPAASGFSHHRREHRAEPQRQQRAEPQRPQRSESHHHQRGRDSHPRGGGGERGQRGGRG